MINDGIELLFETKITKVKLIEGSKTSWNPQTWILITLENTKTGHTFEREFNSLLLAAGRSPNVLNLGLEDIGVQFDETNGVQIDDYLWTSI